MAQSNASTMPAHSGDIGSGEKRSSRLARRRSSQAARRRWLILFGVVVVVVVGILANIGPLTHYQEARARLQKATAKVDALQTQKAELQGQVAKLSETGYLETLAREELTYARSGEELYIVTKPAGQTGTSAAAGVSTTTTAGSGIGAGAMGNLGPLPASLESQSEAGGSALSSDTSLPAATDGSPGFLERTLDAIRRLF